MSIDRLLLVFVLCLVSVACGVNAPCKPKSHYLDLPSFSAMVRTGEILKSIVIEEECGAMWGVQRMSDGWSSTLTPRGEDYTLSIFPPAHREVTDFDDGPPQIAVMLRGQWSDCYNLELIVNIEADGANRMRAFQLEDNFSLPWVEDTEYVPKIHLNRTTPTR
jgi:hypothetical protein